MMFVQQTRNRVIDRQDMITLLMPLLEEAMREKAAKNGHKKPLSEETDSDLRDMAHAENGEFELELAWVKRFGREPRAVLLEMADWIILRGEQARRVGALSDVSRDEGDREADE